MRLYVVGPAFGCPSIDPQCNAAVALLNAWERRNGESWELVCANTEFDRLPLLEVDGRRLSGFRQIARYLATEKASHYMAAEHKQMSEAASSRDLFHPMLTHQAEALKPSSSPTVRR